MIGGDVAIILEPFFEGRQLTTNIHSGFVILFFFILILLLFFHGTILFFLLLTPVTARCEGCLLIEWKVRCCIHSVEVGGGITGRRCHHHELLLLSRHLLRLPPRLLLWFSNEVRHCGCMARRCFFFWFPFFGRTGFHFRCVDNLLTHQK